MFNAFAVLVVVIFGWSALHAGTSSDPLVWAVLGFVALITVWLNVFAAYNPRFLAYGPREYLRESEMAHERELVKLKG